MNVQAFSSKQVGTLIQVTIKRSRRYTHSKYRAFSVSIIGHRTRYHTPYQLPSWVSRCFSYRLLICHHGVCMFRNFWNQWTTEWITLLRPFVSATGQRPPVMISSLHAPAQIVSIATSFKSLDVVSYLIWFWICQLFAFPSGVAILGIWVLNLRRFSDSSTDRHFWYVISDLII